MEKKRIVIVGAGFAGLFASKALKNADADVIVIDRKNHHLFQPFLYQVATAGLSPAEIATPIRHVLRNHANVTVLMKEVVDVDAKGRKVLFVDGELSYDELVLATGSLYNYFGHEEWGKLAPCLKTVEDATLLRRKILLAFEKAEMEDSAEEKRKLLTFILVGGGPTGVEMAGAISELARKALASDFRNLRPSEARIVLCEAGPRILAAFSEASSREAMEELRRIGVDVRLHAKVESIEPEGAFVNGEKIDSSTVIWTAGVKASPVGKWLKCETDRIGRVKVNTDLTVPGHPEISVIGDSAFVAAAGGSISLPALAPVAMQEGRYVARRLKAKLAGAASFPPFRYIDKGTLATVGRSFAVTEIGKLRFSGFFAWILWLTVHIFYLIGFENRILVMIQWAWAYVTFQRGARLITNAPETKDFERN